MIELLHIPATHPALLAFLQANPNVSFGDFDSAEFAATKKAVKISLNALQGGLCVYCEMRLAGGDGQVDHIKAQHGAYAHLAFVYTNYAHSCITQHTCGQKKKAGLLPIEPGPGCNARFMLSTDGALEAMPNQSRKERHEVRQTRDMLGLQAPALQAERKKWGAAVLELMRLRPDLLPQFLADKPFRFVLRRLFAE